MAKRKRKISEIKNALLSNTSFINNTDEPKEVAIPVAKNAVELDKKTLAKLKLLANYYGKEYTDLINEALGHYLRIKKLDIDEALKNIVVGDDEE
ncbi:MAG: hypothetical protein DRJ07_16490 [Bacteroidetes bacterium]|nr:MAG: hypothetical protein DRJ07_16490 [Bacteroidota bacterium]